MDVLIDFIAILLGGALSLAVLSGIDPLLRLIRRRRGSPSAVAPPPPPPSSPPPPSWALTLLVDLDHETGLFWPSVQLRGSSVPFEALLRLEVVDDSGLIRVSSERPLPPLPIGTQVALPPFAAPGDAAVTDVLRWHWDVVMEDWRGEQARWREHPAPAGALNAEAELELPGVAEI